jgi:hypothetical protein
MDYAHFCSNCISIEAPRSQLQGISDHQLVFLFLFSLTPQQATGNKLSGIQMDKKDNCAG